MNRRLFVGKIVAGVSLLNVPSSLIAHPLSSSVDTLHTVASVEKAAQWIQNGALGSLQHITLSHVYSPEQTSLSTLMTLVQKDMATVSNLLGTDVPISSQALLELSPSEFGSYSAQLERDGVTITWQGLAQIGGEANKPTTRLKVYGSRGIVQENPDGRGYQLIDLQAQRTQTANQLSEVPKRLTRRALFGV